MLRWDNNLFCKYRATKSLSEKGDRTLIIGDKNLLLRISEHSRWETKGVPKPHSAMQIQHIWPFWECGEASPLYYFFPKEISGSGMAPFGCSKKEIKAAMPGRTPKKEVSG